MNTQKVLINEAEGPSHPGFWQGKRVTVTGGAGFLGSYVVKQLHQRNPADIFIPRKRNYDLRDVDAIREMLSDSYPDIVIHLAAHVGGIGVNRSRPAELFYDNMMMGIPLLHESWAFGIEKFIGIGTVCAYPKHAPVPFHEESLWDGFPEETNAPYGLAKKMLLVQSNAYRQQYGFNSIFLLPVNLYGPGDNFDLETSHVIPALIRKCVEAERAGDPQISVWGTGEATREFLYVEDAADGILLATERYNKSDPVNLGSNSEISIKYLVRLIATMTGFQGKVEWDSTKPNGQPRRKLDVSRAWDEFGFVAKTHLTEGLGNTVAWYKRSIDQLAGNQTSDEMQATDSHTKADPLMEVA